MLKKIDLRRIDLNLLHLFWVVLEERHVGRSAERLNLSASAVSHGLGRLRRMLHDPVFLKTPKGVTPTARAQELAEPIRDILTRISAVVSTAAPFDPATSTRRFTIGAPDGVSAVLLPWLLARLRDVAPSVDLSVRQLLPVAGEVALDSAWRFALADLEARVLDLAILPDWSLPVRFHRHVLYEEDFVVAMRQGHPFAERPTLERYCTYGHLVVSHSGDPYGFVDRGLEAQGLARRVALTVPNFMLGLAMLTQSDLVCAVPRRFAKQYASRFDLSFVDLPVQLAPYPLSAVTPSVAMMDDGLAWLFHLIESSGAVRPRHP